jgi:ferric-dicitrate binding protein FerR (iron transport regulator)
MKLDKNNQQHTETLARYLCGEMSEVESSAFEEEIAVSDENKTRIEKMKNQWSAIKGYKEPGTPDARKAWDKLHARLNTEKLIPTRLIKTNSSRAPKLVRIAAFLFILLGVGAVIYFAMSRKSNVEMVRVNTDNESNTLIKTLNDGSVIYIAQNSLFSFPKEFESKSRNVELKGEAFFDITSNPDKPFIIETDEALIQVLGTAFNVKTEDGTGFELFVDRGKVKVSLKKDPSHFELVIAGEKISKFKNNLVKSKHVVSQANSWYRQRMHFKDESLQNIINVLNRNFNTTFVVAEKETGKRKLTVTFSNETVGTMTELICVTLNLKSQNINGSVVLSENKEGATRN